jgi:hypothetical protein
LERLATRMPDTQDRTQLETCVRLLRRYADDLQARRDRR